MIYPSRDESGERSYLLGNLPIEWEVTYCYYEPNGTIYGNVIYPRYALWSSECFQSGDGVGFFDPRDRCVGHMLYTPGNGYRGGDWTYAEQFTFGFVHYEWDEDDLFTEGLRPGEEVALRFWDE